MSKARFNLIIEPSFKIFDVLDMDNFDGYAFTPCAASYPSAEILKDGNKIRFKSISEEQELYEREQRIKLLHYVCGGYLADADTYVQLYHRNTQGTIRLINADTLFFKLETEKITILPKDFPTLIQKQYPLTRNEAWIAALVLVRLAYDEDYKEIINILNLSKVHSGKDDKENELLTHLFYLIERYRNGH